MYSDRVTAKERIETWEVVELQSFEFSDKSDYWVLFMFDAGQVVFHDRQGLRYERHERCYSTSMEIEKGIILEHTFVWKNWVRRSFQQLYQEWNLNVWREVPGTIPSRDAHALSREFWWGLCSFTVRLDPQYLQLK